MEAGRELDMLITERVFGKSFWAQYSTDIGFAWQVVEKLREDGWQCEIKTILDTSYVIVGFSKYNSDRCLLERESALARTMPLAICRAALRAREAERKHKEETGDV